MTRTLVATRRVNKTSTRLHERTRVIDPGQSSPTRATPVVSSSENRDVLFHHLSAVILLRDPDTIRRRGGARCSSRVVRCRCVRLERELRPESASSHVIVRYNSAISTDGDLINDAIVRERSRLGQVIREMIAAMHGDGSMSA